MGPRSSGRSQSPVADLITAESNSGSDAGFIPQRELTRNPNHVADGKENSHLWVQYPKGFDNELDDDAAYFGFPYEYCKFCDQRGHLQANCLVYRSTVTCTDASPFLGPFVPEPSTEPSSIAAAPQPPAPGPMSNNSVPAGSACTVEHPLDADSRLRVAFSSPDESYPLRLHADQTALCPDEDVYLPGNLAVSIDPKMKAAVTTHLLAKTSSLDDAKLYDAAIARSQQFHNNRSTTNPSDFAATVAATAAASVLEAKSIHATTTAVFRPPPKARAGWYVSRPWRLALGVAAVVGSVVSGFVLGRRYRNETRVVIASASPDGPNPTAVDPHLAAAEAAVLGVGMPPLGYKAVADEPPYKIAFDPIRLLPPPYSLTMHPNGLRAPLPTPFTVVPIGPKTPRFNWKLATPDWKRSSTLAGLIGVFWAGCRLIVSSLSYTYECGPVRRGLAASVSEQFNTTGLSHPSVENLSAGTLTLKKVELLTNPEVDVGKQCGRSFRLGETGPARPTTIQHLTLAPVLATLPMVPASSPDNELVALQSRVFGQVVRAQPDAVEAFCHCLQDLLSSPRVLGTVFGSATNPSCPMCDLCPEFPNPHQAVYDAWNSHERVGPSLARLHDEARQANHFGLHSPGAVTGFIKEEPYFKSTPFSVDAVRPRLIQNASQSDHVASGPWHYAFSKRVSACWCPDNWLVYASGHDPGEICQSLQPFDVWFVGDVKAFDAGLDPAILGQLNDLKLRWMHLSGQLKTVLRGQLHTFGTTMKGRHKYQFDGQRRSGDDNTSVDNSVLNCLAHLWVIIQQTGRGLNELSRCLKVVVLGDDIVIGGPRWLDLVDFKSGLAAIGWDSKPQFVYSFVEIGFCSRVVYPTSEGHVFASTPGRFFQRFPFCWNPSATIDVAAKAYGSYLDNSAVPFVRTYLRRIIQVYDTSFRFHSRFWAALGFFSVIIKEDQRPEWAMAAGRLHAANDSTWSLFYARYGLTAEDERNFEHWLRSYDEPGPAVANVPWLIHILECDGLL